MTEIKLLFDLPYPLRVEGRYQVTAAGQIFDVDLSTYYEENPRFPGAETVQNMSLVHEDTNILAHTKVSATFTPQGPFLVADGLAIFAEVQTVAIALANVLIAGARVGFDEHVLEFIHQPARLGPVQFGVTNGPPGSPAGGVVDPLMGGITTRKPARQGPAVDSFANMVRNGFMPTVGEELYLDARRYQIRGNNRMALANLTISFEVRLSDLLSAPARSRGDTGEADDIEASVLGTLGQKHAKRVLGYSLEDAATAGHRTRDAFLWLRTARNQVLHKARIRFEANGLTRDFGDDADLKWLFLEYEWLITHLTSEILRVSPGSLQRPYARTASRPSQPA